MINAVWKCCVNKKKSKSKSAASSGASERKGAADVAIRLIDAMYDLAQTGNLIGLITFALVCWIFYITFKLPVESLETIFGSIGVFLASERFYFFPLISLSVISIITNIVQARIYKSHIQDLTEQRRILVHGLQEGTLKQLKQHNTSGYDVKTGSVSDK